MFSKRTEIHLSTLDPAFRLKVVELLKTCDDIVQKYFHGWTLGVSDSQRDIYEQAGKYSQGRAWDKDAKKWTVTGSPVTWTLTSKHLKTPCEAVDLGLFKDGQYLCPDPKEPKNAEFWLAIAERAVILGIKPGALWKTPDYPHMEKL